MSYCTRDDLGLTEKELIQLTDDMIPPVMVVQTELDRALDYANTMINAHVGERYQLPFTAVPALVQTIAADLTVWKLYYRRKKAQTPEVVQKAYDNSMKLLAQIRDGKIGIGVTPAGSKVEPETGSLQVSTGARMFGDDVMNRY